MKPLVELGLRGMPDASIKTLASGEPPRTRSEDGTDGVICDEAPSKRTPPVGLCVPREARLQHEKKDIKYDTKEIDEATLALLYLVSWRQGPGVRAWKLFDWDTMNRLHEKRLISDPKSKVKSVMLTEEGRESQELFQRLFRIVD